MENEIKMCEYCEDMPAHPEPFYKGYYLCDDCNDKFEDVTGYCSLDCCITGICDGSC